MVRGKWTLSDTKHLEPKTFWHYFGGSELASLMFADCGILL